MKKKSGNNEYIPAKSKLAESFASLMIERIKEMEVDWKKPWVSTSFMGMPQNISGRNYNGMNSLMLMLLSQKQGYTTPIFMTFHQAKAEGFSIKKNEGGFPVMFWRINYLDETGKKITFEEYNNLTPDEQQRCKSYPVGSTYIVFNIDQTNMKELKPELYQKFLEKGGMAGGLYENDENRMVSPEIEYMLENQTWVCPIELKMQNDAFYTPASDKIKVPLKEQFPTNQLFYATLLHEMAHSTGHKDRLNRDMNGGFGSYNYGKEELVAEMTAALACASLGIEKSINPENVAYLKGWLKSISEKPEFILQVMNDVNKAVQMIEKQVWNPELAEQMKEESIKNITEFLESKKDEENNKDKTIRVSEEERKEMSPSIGEQHKATATLLGEQIDEAIVLSQQKKKKEDDTKIVFVLDAQNNNYYIVGEDAEEVSQKLDMQSRKGLADGKEIPFIRFSETEFEAMVHQIIAAEMKIQCTHMDKNLVNEAKQQQIDELASTVYEEFAGYAKDIKEYMMQNHKNDSIVAMVDEDKQKTYVFDEDAEMIAKWMHEKCDIVKDQYGYAHVAFQFDYDRLHRVADVANNEGAKVTVMDAIVVRDIAEQTRMNKKDMPEQKNQHELHIAYLGNGLTAWEEGDNEYTAHISPERVLRMDKEFQQGHTKLLQSLAKEGNRIIGNNDNPKLALRPMNLATRYIPQPYGQPGIPVSLEKVRGHEYICAGTQVIAKNGEPGHNFNRLPVINRPKEYIVGLRGIDNVRIGLEYLRKAGISDQILRENFFYQALTAAEKDLNTYEREMKHLYFKIEELGEDDVFNIGITDFSDDILKLDAERTLPEYYMKDNSLHYNKPGINRTQSVEQMMAGGTELIVKIEDINNFKKVLADLDAKGVTVSPNISKELQEMHKNRKNIPESEKAVMYLLVKNGQVLDSEPNIHEEEYEVPILTYDGKEFKKNITTEEDMKNDQMPRAEIYQEFFAKYKEKYPEALQMYEVGNFYELYDKDAEKAAEILGLTLTNMEMDGKQMKMVAFPKPALDTYLPKVIRYGQKVAIINSQTIKQEKKESFINPLNNSDMAKKEKVAEKQSEVQNEKVQEQTVEQTAKKQPKEGVHIYQLQNSPGIYGVNVVKDGVRSETAVLSKEDRDQYFQNIKGKTGEEAEAVRKAVADKYIGADGKKLVQGSASQQEQEKKDKPFIIRHTSEENAQRISDVQLKKRSDGVWTIQCKVDGNEQSRHFLDPKKEMGKKTIDALFAKWDTLTDEQKATRKVDLAAILYNGVLKAPKQEQSQGLGR